MSPLVDPNTIFLKKYNVDHFDLTFVGAGLSSTWTLITYLKQLRNQPPSSVSKILVVEKSTDMFKGIAYGDRSSDSTLIINCLGDFLPQSELSVFEDWIKANIEWLFERFRACGSSYTKQWLEQHASKLISDDLSLVYIPRYIFGLYLEQQANTIIRECEELGIVSVHKIQAQIVDIKPESEYFGLKAKFSNGRVSRIISSQVVLGLGSPPSRGLLDQRSESRPGVLVNNPFEPGMKEMLSSIYDLLDHTETGRNNLVVVGSNASAADVVCNIVNYRDCASLINKIRIMSPSGALPDRFSESCATGVDYQPQHLEQLIDGMNISASDIYDAAKEDISVAKTGNISVAITIPVISEMVGRLIKQLSKEELKKFIAHTGNAIGKMQRRAGDDYSNILDGLILRKQLSVMKGLFVDFRSNSNGTLTVEYRDEIGNDQEVDDIKSIINCSGANHITPECHDPLLRNLLKRKICEVNESGIGFKLSDNLEASKPGVFVVGPMIAGNIIGDTPVWHVEHCGRIQHFAARLGSHLASDARGVSKYANRSISRASRSVPY